jgi:hypothetical protein
MRRSMRAVITVVVVAMAGVQCGGDDPSGPSGAQCAGVQGASIAFCRQVDNYVAGFGVQGQDFITVTCIVGPQGATVSNSTNGSYSCGGTYKLTTYATATISLAWGGSTSYSEYEEAEVTRGEGTFTVHVTKSSGGQGNLFFSMSSGSNWMFDTVPVNTQCGSADATVEAVAVTADGSDLSAAAARGETVRVKRYAYRNE